MLNPKGRGGSIPAILCPLSHWLTCYTRCVISLFPSWDPLLSSQPWRVTLSSPVSIICLFVRHFPVKLVRNTRFPDTLHLAYGWLLLYLVFCWWSHKGMCKWCFGPCDSHEIQLNCVFVCGMRVLKIDMKSVLYCILAYHCTKQPIQAVVSTFKALVYLILERGKTHLARACYAVDYVFKLLSHLHIRCYSPHA